MTSPITDTLEAVELGGPVLPGHELLCEMLSVISSGAPEELYLEGRNLGSNHAELMWAMRQPFGLRIYNVARGMGVTHDEVVGLCAKGISPTDLLTYCQGRKEGLFHRDLTGALAAGLELEAYLSVRRVGATHDEALEASDARIDLDSYWTARRAGVTHSEVCEAAGDGEWALDIYVDDRVRGATHADALETQLEQCGRHGTGRGWRMSLGPEA
jgi:hypothetical protein